jgi:phytoene/squalene synthetase
MCETEVRQFLAALWTATDTLPAAVRPFVHAIHGWTVRTDRIADGGSPEGRQERFARWQADTLADQTREPGRRLTPPCRAGLNGTDRDRQLPHGRRPSRITSINGRRSQAPRCNA